MIRTFSKGQAVTATRDYASVRYRVERVHRDGTYTVRAIFALDEQGRDLPCYLGYKYRVGASVLTPLPNSTSDE